MNQNLKYLFVYCIVAPAEKSLNAHRLKTIPAKDFTSLHFYTTTLIRKAKRLAAMEAQ